MDRRVAADLNGFAIGGGVGMSNRHLSVLLAVACFITCVPVLVQSLPSCALSYVVSGTTCTFPACTVTADFSPDIVQLGLEIVNGGVAANDTLSIVFEGITAQSVASDILVNFQTLTMPTFANPIRLDVRQLDGSGVVGFSTRLLLNTSLLPANSSVLLSRVAVTSTGQTFTGPFVTANCSTSGLCIAPGALRNVSYLQVDRCILNVTSLSMTTIGLMFADAEWTFGNNAKLINLSSNALFVASAASVSGAVVGIMFPPLVLFNGKNITLLIASHQRRGTNSGMSLLNSRPFSMSLAVAVQFPGLLKLSAGSAVILRDNDFFVEATPGSGALSVVSVVLLSFQSISLSLNATLYITNAMFNQTSDTRLSISSQLMLTSASSVSVESGAIMSIQRLTLLGGGGVIGSPIGVALDNVSLARGQLSIAEVSMQANVSQATTLTLKAISLSFGVGLTNNSVLTICDCIVVVLSLAAVLQSFQFLALTNASLRLDTSSALNIHSNTLVSNFSTSSTSLLLINISAVVAIVNASSITLSNNTVDSYSQQNSIVLACRDTVFLIMSRPIEVSNGSVLLLEGNSLITRNAAAGASVVGLLFDGVAVVNAEFVVRDMQYRFDVTNTPGVAAFFFRSAALNVTSGADSNDLAVVEFDDCRVSLGAGAVESASPSKRVLVDLGTVAFLSSPSSSQAEQRIRFTGCTFNVQWTAISTATNNQSFQLITASISGNGTHATLDISRSDFTLNVALSGSFVTFAGGVAFAFSGDPMDVFPNLSVNATRLSLNATNFQAKSVSVVGLQLMPNVGTSPVNVSCGYVVFQNSSVRVVSRQAMTVAFSLFSRVESSSSNLPSGPTVIGKGVAFTDTTISVLATRIEPTTIFQGDNVYGVVMNLYVGSNLGVYAPRGITSAAAMAMVTTTIDVNSSNCPGQVYLCQAMGIYSSVLSLSGSFRLSSSVITVSGHRVVRSFFVAALTASGENFVVVNNSISLTLPSNTAGPVFRSTSFVISSLTLLPTVKVFNFDGNSGTLSAQYTSTTIPGTATNNLVGGTVVVKSVDIFNASLSDNAFNTTIIVAQTNSNIYGVAFTFQFLPCGVILAALRNKVNVTGGTGLYSLTSLQALWLVLSLGGTNFTVEVADNVLTATDLNTASSSDSVTALGLYLAQGATFTVPSYTADLGSLVIARNVISAVGVRSFGAGVQVFFWFIPGELRVVDNNVALYSGAPSVALLTLVGVALIPFYNFSGAASFSTNISGNKVYVSMSLASTTGKYYGLSFGGPTSTIPMDLSNSTGFLVSRNDVTMAINMASQTAVTHIGIALFSARVVSLPTVRQATTLQVVDNVFNFSNSNTNVSNAIFIGPSPAGGNITITQCSNCVLNVSGNKISSMRGVSFTGSWDAGAVSSAIALGVITVDGKVALLMTSNSISDSVDAALLSLGPAEFTHGATLAVDNNELHFCSSFRGFVVGFVAAPVLRFSAGSFLVIRRNLAMNTSLFTIVNFPSGLALDSLSSCIVSSNSAGSRFGSTVAMFALGLRIKQITRSSTLTVQNNEMYLSNATSALSQMQCAIFLSDADNLQLGGKSSVYFVNNTGGVSTSAFNVTFVLVNGSVVYSPDIPLRGGTGVSAFVVKGNLWSNGSSVVWGPSTSLLRSNVTLMTLSFRVGCNSLGDDFAAALVYAQYVSPVLQLLPASFAAQLPPTVEPCGKCDVTVDCFAPNARRVASVNASCLCECSRPGINLSAVGVILSDGNMQCANPVNGLSASESRSLVTLSGVDTATTSRSRTVTRSTSNRSTLSRSENDTATFSRSVSVSLSVTRTSITPPPTITVPSPTNSSTRSGSPTSTTTDSVSQSLSSTRNVTRLPAETPTNSVPWTLTRSTVSAPVGSTSRSSSIPFSRQSLRLTWTTTGSLSTTRTCSRASKLSTASSTDTGTVSTKPTASIDPFNDLPFAISIRDMFAVVTFSPTVSPSAADSVWVAPKRASPSAGVTNGTHDELLFTVPYSTIANAVVRIMLEVRKPQSVKPATAAHVGFSFSGPSAVAGASNATHMTFTFASVRYNQYLAKEFVVQIAASSFACPGKALPSISLTLVVQPSATAVSAESVRAATNVASSLSIATGNPSSGIAAARVAMLQNLLQCAVDLTQDDGNSFTGFHFGPLRGQYMRGAVVGNFALFLTLSSVGLLIAAVAAVYGAIWKHKPWIEGFTLVCDVLHFPSCTLVPLAAVLQPTLTSGMNLIILNPAPGDFVIGVAGVAAMMLIVASFSYVLLCDFRCTIKPRTAHDKAKRDIAIAGTIPFRSFLFQDDETTTRKNGSTSSEPEPTAALRAVKYFFEADEHWVISDEAATEKRWKRRFMFIFQDYRCRWYPLLDFWTSAILGVVAGINLQKSTVCIAQISLIFGGYLLLLVSCLFLRPAFSRFTSLYLICINGCGFVSAASTLIGALLDDNLALSASSVSALLVSVLSMVKTIPDLVLLVLALPTLLKTVLKPFQDAHDFHELLRVQDDTALPIFILPTTEKAEITDETSVSWVKPVLQVTRGNFSIGNPHWSIARSIIDDCVRDAASPAFSSDVRHWTIADCTMLSFGPVPMCERIVSRVLVPRVESWLFVKKIVAGIVSHACVESEGRRSGIVGLDDLIENILCDTNEESGKNTKPMLTKFSLADGEETFENPLQMISSEKHWTSSDDSSDDLL